MAYETKDLLKQSLEVINKYGLVFIEDVVSLIDCSKATFYEHKLNESDEIKAAMRKNKTTMKVSLRKKWLEGENATSQLALYKLIATEEERRRLSLNYEGKDTDGEGSEGVWEMPDGGDFEM